MSALATMAAGWTSTLLDRYVSQAPVLAGGYHAGFVLATAITLIGTIAALGLPRGTPDERPV